MASESPSSVQPPAASAPQKFGATLKSFLTAVMGLLSILVFGLAAQKRSVLWLWMGFVCGLISGVFVQLLINRRRKNASKLSGK